MLRKIHIENCFAHANSVFDFQTGMTAISGRNFRGKSQILEMVRFALFGSQALRTVATDYKGAKVTLWFDVMGKSLRVERSTINAKLYEGDDLICTGTKPVNAKIVSIFGYGLAVFDTANVATQGSIEALGAMQPADRKRLVDSTIGLNILDDLAKWCGDEAALKKRELEAVRSTATAPVAPERPEGYRNLADLLADRERLTALVIEKRSVAQAVSAEPPVLQAPVCNEPRTLEALETISRARGSAQAAWQALSIQSQKLPLPPTVTIEEIEEEEIRNANQLAQVAAQNFMAVNPRPSFSEEDLDRFEAMIKLHDQWKAWTDLKAKGHHGCPKCQHTWPVEAARMAEFGDWAGKAEPSKPKLDSLLVIQSQRHYWAKYKASETERAAHRLVLAAHPVPLTGGKYTNEELARFRKAHDATPRWRALAEELVKVEDELKGLPDVTEPLRVRAAYERALTLHAASVEKHDAWASNLPTWQARLAELGDVEEQAEATIALQIMVQTYDNMLVRYERDVVAYGTAQERITNLEGEVGQLTLARGALTELKSRVKGYLVPSLSRVSSLIISQMTGGAISDIYISEDFDIHVGGKPIDGLSGCGKAAANLAIRIGLGQVLTNKVFSVFMADEIDAAMDAENATFTQECLRRLTASISQIILVSHKDAEADHYIKL